MRTCRISVEGNIYISGFWSVLSPSKVAGCEIDPWRCRPTWELRCLSLQHHRAPAQNRSIDWWLLHGTGDGDFNRCCLFMDFHQTLVSKSPKLFAILHFWLRRIDFCKGQSPLELSTASFQVARDEKLIKVCAGFISVPLCCLHPVAINPLMSGFIIFRIRILIHTLPKDRRLQIS